LAVHAVALAHWHDQHPRCARCGSATVVADAGAFRRCPSCQSTHFPRTDPAAIMLVTDAADRCLLGHNRARPPGWFSTLAGFVEPGESPEQAVVREVLEEVGVEVGAVDYAGSQPWPFPSSLMLGFFAAALTTDVTVDGDEIDDARWFTRPELTAAVTAGQVGLPTRVSIAGALLTSWYGRHLPANKLEL
jgi:NAD+ diphosphatase